MTQQDEKMTKKEILANWNMFVGSQATNYGEDLTKRHDELWWAVTFWAELVWGFIFHSDGELGYTGFRVQMGGRFKSLKVPTAGVVLLEHTGAVLRN